MPKSMSGVQAHKLISRLWHEYETGDQPEWDGMLYRAGSDTGIFYHVAAVGADFYNDGGRHATRPYQFPSFRKVLYVDIDSDFEWIERQSGDFDDIALAIETLIPKLVKKGYDGIVINGDTGAEVTGPSIEVVDLTKYRPGPDQLAEIMPD